VPLHSRSRQKPTPLRIPVRPFAPTAPTLRRRRCPGYEQVGPQFLNHARGPAWYRSGAPNVAQPVRQCYCRRRSSAPLPS
jgi:hypothetical protein